MNKAGQKKSFAQTYPEYVKLWHPSKNGLVALSDLAPGSERVSWWVSDNGHEYQRKPVHQARASGKCPSCKGFAFKYPHLALLWHPTKNHQKVLSDIFRGSQRKAWWICVNNHEYERTPYDQVKFSGHCPVCVGRKIGEDNHLGVEFPDVAKQWNFSRNGALLPDHVRPQSNKTVWWSCDFGHEYQMIIYQKTAGAGCPFCLGKRASPEDNLSVRFPGIAKEWDYDRNGDLLPTDVRHGAERRVWWKCSLGHSWKVSVNNRTSGRNCPHCKPQTSRLEIFFYSS